MSVRELPELPRVRRPRTPALPRNSQEGDRVDGKWLVARRPSGRKYLKYDPDPQRVNVIQSTPHRPRLHTPRKALDFRPTVNIFYWWNSPHLPFHARCAVSTWEQWLQRSPTRYRYDIHFANPETVDQYVDPAYRGRFRDGDVDLKAVQSDQARYAILAHTGGCYMDAGVYLFNNLDDWADNCYKKGWRFQAFWNPRNTYSEAVPCIENSFLFCERGFPMMVEWAAEALKIEPDYGSIDRYIDGKKREKPGDSVEMSGPNLCIDYHITFHMLTKILRKNGGIAPDNPWSRGIRLRNAMYGDMYQADMAGLFEPYRKAPSRRTFLEVMRSIRPPEGLGVRKLVSHETRLIDRAARRPPPGVAADEYERQVCAAISHGR